MILLDEAVDRFARAARAYGVRLDPWKRRGRAQTLISEVEAAISPLLLPAELRAFWSSWNPATAQPPVFDGFIPLDQIAERYEIDCPPCPAILLPIADWTHGRVWIELATGAHPGGRILHSYHDESEVTLWTFGISGLLDLVSLAFEQDFIDDRTGSIDPQRMESIIESALDESLPEGSARRFEAVDRSLFPSHWQRAEGITSDHFALRGESHTVSSFRLAREVGDHVSATLVGTFQTSVGGGPLHGCVGTFEDSTGSLQVFVPQVTAVHGAVGRGGAVEIDVVAVAPNGSALDSLSAKRDLEHVVAGGLLNYGNDMIIRLFEQMKYLDTSIVVTALRPIR